MMTTLGKTKRRQFATVMLFVWAFALVAGIANACALGDTRVKLATGLSAAFHHGDAVEEHWHTDEAGLPPVPNSHDREEACQKFCDDERSLLSQQAKGLGSPGGMLPLLVQFTTLAWTSADARATEVPVTVVPMHDTGPPIPIRLLRLTI